MFNIGDAFYFFSKPRKKRDIWDNEEVLVALKTLLNFSSKVDNLTHRCVIWLKMLSCELLFFFFCLFCFVLTFALPKHQFSVIRGLSSHVVQPSRHWECFSGWLNPAVIHLSHSHLSQTIVVSLTWSTSCWGDGVHVARNPLLCLKTVLMADMRCSPVNLSLRSILTPRLSLVKCKSIDKHDRILLVVVFNFVCVFPAQAQIYCLGWDCRSHV